MKKVLTLFISLLMVLTFSACSSNTENDICSVWTISDITFSDSSLVTEQELWAFEYAYKDTSLSLNADNTGTLKYLSKEYKISWKLEDKSNLLIYIDGVLFEDLGVSDEGLCWDIPTEKVAIFLTFTKDSKEEYTVREYDFTASTNTSSESEVVIDTEYYTINVPYNWEEDCFYEVAEGEHYNYTLSFYDKASHNEINAGWLFSINLPTEFEDYSKHPDYDVLGSLEVYRIGAYNIIVTYPTDVQYSDKTRENYCEMSSKIPDILKTISFKDECTFSEKPIPFENTATSTELNEKYLGRWEDLHIGTKGMKFDDYDWNVEFRSDGTGVFEFVYGPNDIEYFDFTFSTFLRRDTCLMEGVSIFDESGEELKLYVTCKWDNQLQTGMMTLQDWENPDLYWSFKLVTQ